MKLATVQYQIATYSGEVRVVCGDNADDDEIIAKVKRLLSRNGPLPFGYESFSVTKIEEGA